LEDFNKFDEYKMSQNYKIVQTRQIKQNKKKSK